ncbi:hypothetical protein ABZ741_39250 [Streptomyces globisporus]|uniref:hypothetical protein n=1 Tax=Streptomyces globisporus TaxID=1908 RepID=UPI0034601693|nr:hypothetical protein OG838_09590 [Streptomyces globisporus]WSV89505.1 hypothetical protein OG449_09165 [Streptomyces globisporus]
MTTTMMFDEYTQAIKNRAVELNGTAVVVELTSGKALTGTLSYALADGPQSSKYYPNVLTVTVSTKAYTVRLDAVAAIGQG